MPPDYEIASGQASIHNAAESQVAHGLEPEFEHAISELHDRTTELEKRTERIVAQVEKRAISNKAE